MKYLLVLSVLLALGAAPCFAQGLGKHNGNNWRNGSGMEKEGETTNDWRSNLSRQNAVINRDNTRQNSQRSLLGTGRSGDYFRPSKDQPHPRSLLR